MILPTTYFATLALVLLSVLCLGSWANTFKATRNWRFELYYFDFAFGLLISAGIGALTFGTQGFDGFSFMDDVLHASKSQDLYVFLAGVIFNLGNMLLVAGISVAGMALAFPVSFGLALAIGVLWTFLRQPNGSAVLVFAGAAITVAAVWAAAQAYRLYKLDRLDEQVRTGQVKSTKKIVSLKAVFLCLASGIFLGLFVPLLQRGMEGDTGLGPYSAAFIFAAGAFLSTLLFNLFFMNLPVAGQPVEIFDYFKGSFRTHLLGIAGGVIWYTGTVCTLVALHAETKASVSPSLAYGLGQGSALLSALWGIFVWKEFYRAPSKVRALLTVMLTMFLLGVVMVSVAPLVGK